MATRRRRTYLIYLDKAKAAGETAIDSFNRVKHPYKIETTLLLLSNAWELLAKAVLLQGKQSITQGQRGDTISGEKAVYRLQQRGELDKHQGETIQQIISLRNAAAHSYLPDMPQEVLHHLLYFGSKFFRDLVFKKFPNQAKDLEDTYLSLSFSDMTTYADKIQKVVSKLKKSQGDKRLAWLLERGIEFDGSQYITEKQFERKYRDKHKIMPHLALGEFIKENEMIRVVPVQAPKNFTADLTLRKGSSKDSSLPVVVKKTDVDEDYPHLTKELARELGVNMRHVVSIVQRLGLKGDPKYHQEIRTSKSGSVHRYSEAAKERIRNEINQRA